MMLHRPGQPDSEHRRLRQLWWGNIVPAGWFMTKYARTDFRCAGVVAVTC